MESFVEFAFDTTCYLIFRYDEWGFSLRVSDAGEGSVHLEFEFMHRELTTILSPRRATCALGDGVVVPLLRLDGTQEELEIWFEQVKPPGVLIGVELPEGVAMEPFEEGDSAIA